MAPGTEPHVYSAMEKVQHITRAAIRRASTMEVPQQAKQNMQNLFVNFCLILICLLLIYIIVLLM
ncbi:cardiac phospholamban [Silurus meridionalis]|nr:cardiac phospholamban [Silurus meridionalis]